MDTPHLPDAFYLTLDQTPDDRTTLCALADWFEDEGDLSSASCVRWTIRRGLHPIRFSRDGHWRELVTGPSWHDGWHWWVVDEPNWAQGVAARLPAGLWDRLGHSCDYEPSVFKEYPTRRSAYEALFEAWPSYAPTVDAGRGREVAR